MSMHEVKQVTAAELKTLLAGARPVLVCFLAEWSAPCRELAPVLELAADGFYGAMETVSVDPDAEPLLAAELRLASLPTMLLFIGGTERERIVGTRTYDELERRLLKYIPEQDGQGGDA